MASVHTLYSEPTNAKKFQGCGYKLDSTRECELKSQRNELLLETEYFANKCSEFRNAKVLAEARSDMLNKELEKKNDKILSFQEEIDQLINAKNKGDLNIKQFKKEIKQLKKEIKRFKKEIIELQNKNTSLISQDSLKELSLTGYRAKYYAKMEEANSLQSKIKLLEEKLISACEDVTKKEFDILSLNSKINELDQQKSKAMTSILSNQVEILSKPIIGGDDEKNTQSEEQSSISNSSNISADNNLSQYLYVKKNMEENKIDINYVSELPKVDTPISVHEEVVSFTPKFSKTDISPDDIHISSDMPLSILKSVTSYLAQRENSEASIKTHNTPSLIESHPQIPIEEIGAIRSSLEALPLPIMASSLMSPLSAYMLLTLLIIAVIWFVVLRRELSIGKKSNQLRGMWNNFLAKDKALYPTLFVNHLWYHCSAPILWRRIEFSVEGYRQNQCGKNTSGPLYWRLMKIKRVMCGKTKHLYCSKMVYLKLAGLKISDTLLSAILRLCPNIHTLILDRSYGFSNIPIIEIARCCPKLLHLSFDACKAITDRCITQFCPNLIYLNLSSHHHIKDISFCAIARSCVNLRHLDLSSNYYMTDNAVCDIVHSCANIQYLILHRTYITDKTIYDIAHYCSNLLVLDVGDCWRISKESIHFLLSKKPTLDIILDKQKTNIRYNIRYVK
ncbi:hypothetical protein Glove_258g67 [Diversispora epigaea]|uniref:F-box/LRR-repeat protein 15-like leucin rich repeat domain-containing protein n=1 Tax=Diversispora epigaea TaxID=1348612 RepID=A0A397IB22_9GLOM|nr:hypothetical protein Glove_258g67 [Diversispora epigaea]